jgi:PAS domain S-box-containing protein
MEHLSKENAGAGSPESREVENVKYIRPEYRPDIGYRRVRMKSHNSKSTVQLLYTLIDMLPDLVYVKDTKSRFLLANQALVRIFGLKRPEEVLGKTDFDLHPPELARQYYADEQALLESGQPLINHEEPVLNHTTGEMGWLLTTKIPFRDKRGQIAGFIGLNRDITERKKAEQALQELSQTRTAELETLQRIMQQIVAVAGRLGDSSIIMTDMSTQMASVATETSHQVTVISATSQQINEYIGDFSNAIIEIAASINELSLAMSDVIAMVTNVVSLADTSHTAITRLESYSKDVGNISKLITAISQQTKFLALNANIEAARVGDAGQGFKVVADEVKSLARNTAIAAEDITHKIHTIQTNSHETTEAITRLVKIIQEVSEFSQNVSFGLTEQAQTTTRVSNRIGQISQGSEEIAQAISDVAATTEHSAQQAATIQHEAEALSTIAEQLRQLVTAYHR